MHSVIDHIHIFIVPLYNPNISARNNPYKITLRGFTGTLSLEVYRLNHRALPACLWWVAMAFLQNNRSNIVPMILPLCYCSPQSQALLQFWSRTTYTASLVLYFGAGKLHELLIPRPPNGGAQDRAQLAGSWEQKELGENSLDGLASIGCSQWLVLGVCCHSCVHTAWYNVPKNISLNWLAKEDE